jgi:alpha-glucoside transport system substrate-binding protein
MPLMPKSPLLPVLAVLTAASLLVGCQGGQRTSIEVIGYWSAGEQESFTQVLDLFERETGIDVRYVPAGYDLPTLLQTRIQGRNPPNVAITPLPGVIQQWATANVLKPLDSSVEAEVNKNYAKVWRDLGTIDGKLYAVFFKATNKSIFWYNERIMMERGLLASKNSENGQFPPETWDQLVRLSEKLSDQGVSPIAVGAAEGWVLTDWFENVYLQTAGSKMYDQLSRHGIAWTDDSVRRAFDKMAEILGQDAMIEGGRAGALQLTFEDSVLKVFGPQASAAMIYEGDFVSGVIRTEGVDSQNAKFFPFPKIEAPAPSGTGNDDPGRVVVGGDAAVALRDDAATMKLMSFLASPEAAAVWAERGGFLSPNRSLPSTEYPDEETRTMAEQLIGAADRDEARFDMSDLYPAQFGASKGVGMWKIMQDFLDHPANIDTLLRQLETEASKVTQ